MYRLKVWREGALAARAHRNFSMNPYSPGPKPRVNDTRPDPRSLWWAQGFWWATKNDDGQRNGGRT